MPWLAAPRREVPLQHLSLRQVFSALSLRIQSPPRPNSRTALTSGMRESGRTGFLFKYPWPSAA